MEELFENGEKTVEERREHPRRQIPAAVTCTFYEEVLQGKGSFKGFIQDISLGGVALEIRDDFLSISETMLLYTSIEMHVEFNFPEGIQHISFSGLIRWYKRIKKKDKNFLYLGIKFQNLNEQSKEVLEKYLSLGTGDTNLIWNLWDNLTTQP
jgi:c-di-GMP-binding flagellar brake protein YcgR